jgi:hypothetical protein
VRLEAQLVDGASSHVLRDGVLSPADIGGNGEEAGLFKGIPQRGIDPLPMLEVGHFVRNPTCDAVVKPLQEL